MPPMITTISELSRNAVSSPGAREIIVPPSTPPRPASIAPIRKAPANTSCTLIPSAETMSRSSTPARTILPKRVRLMTYQSPRPISSAAPSTTTPRKNPKRTSPGRLMLSGQSLGALMSFEMPPKAASIWSAKMTERAIVISAWRRSCPWFQRRNTCWMRTPTIPTIRVASTAGTTHETRLCCASSPPLSERPSPGSSVNHFDCISSAR